ncbi:hypothetical protein [Entomobacter blattae]|nr:hypothetical protein [Entomobacter blattae]
MKYEGSKGFVVIKTLHANIANARKLIEAVLPRLDQPLKRMSAGVRICS